MKKIYRDAETRTEVRVYDSPMEFVEDGCEGGKRAGWLSAYNGDRNTRDWTTNRATTWDQYKAVFPTAYPEGREYLDRMAAELNLDVDQPEAVVRKQRWVEDDGEVCLARAFAGEDRMFRGTARAGRRVRTKNVAIVYNATISSYTSCKDAWRVGAGVAVAIDKMEAAGFSVEAWVVLYSTGTYHNGNLLAAALAKRAGEPLSTDILAGMFCPDFVRGACFGMGSTGGVIAPSSNSMGMPTQLTPNMLKHLDLTENIQCIQASCQNAQHKLIDSAEQARRIIREATEQ